MSRPDWPQLDERTLAILRDAVSRLGSIAATATALGYKRPSISMALAGRYPGDCRHLRSAIYDTFAERVDCPHLCRDISPAECKSFRERPLPTSSREAFKHWQACQRCPLNPQKSGASS